MTLREEIWLVVFGWILGTLTPTVVDTIRDESRRRAMLRAIGVELHDLRQRIAVVLLSSARSTGKLDRRILAIVRPLIERHSELPGFSPLGESFGKLLEMGEDAYIAYVNARGEAEDTVGVYPPIDAPLLRLKAAELTSLPPDGQRRLLRVLEEIDLFNHQVALMREQHNLSFTLTGENHKINDANLRKAHQKLRVRAEQLLIALNGVLAVNGKVLDIVGSADPL